jgi:hypothetical protein
MFTKRCIGVLVLSLVVAGCLEDKAVDLVVTGETYADFSQGETTSDWTSSALVDVGQDLRDILEENGMTRDDLDGAQVTSVHYGVADFVQDHDWSIMGEIVVTYDGQEGTLVHYDAPSLEAALGKKIPLELEREGVDIVNGALQDFMEGQEEVVLGISIVNDTTAPVPSEDDAIVFDWRAWLAIQVRFNQTVYGVPDPF